MNNKPHHSRRFSGAAFALLQAAFLLLAACNNTHALAQKAAHGDKDAQYEYARRLLTGKRAPRNTGKALCWFNIAAQQKHAGAEAALGVCYERGIGTARDTRQARQWYQRAISHGHPHALLALTWLELKEKRPQHAIRLLEKGSSDGLIPAQLTLAYLYMGHEGVAENPSRAVDHIRYAAIEGSGEAAFLMFLCFADGYGVPAEPSLAYGWLDNAASLGFEPAQKALDALPPRKKQAAAPAVRP